MASEEVPPLLTATAKQVQSIVSQRAEEILRHSEMDNDALGGDDCEISCTPAFQDSKLGGLKSTQQIGATDKGQSESSGDDAVLLLDEGDTKLPELEHVVAAKNDTLEPGDFSLASSNDKQFCDYNTTEVIHVGSVTVTDGILGDDSDLAKSSADDKCTASPVSQLATTEHATSFCDNFFDVDYPTLWQLTTEEAEDIENFYVPALVSIVSPLKV